ncbi:MAG: rod shape-determining protein MreC [Actinomycetes bacterium]
MNRDRRRARLVLGVLIVISLLAITLDLRGGSTFSGPRNVLSGVVSPVQRVASNVTRPIGRFFSDLTKINSNREKINKLTADNRELRAKRVEDKATSGKADLLSQTLNLAASGGYRVVPAQIISMSQSGFSRTIGIDAGSNSGIKPDMTVIAAGGLVGRVVSAAANSATVLVITDESFKVGVRLAGTQALGVISGRGSGVLDLELLDAQTEVRIGDELVARGSVGAKPFVPGVPVGRVISVVQTPGALTRIAVVKPFVNLATLDIVAVVVSPPKTDPRDSLLPRPVPTPTVTVTVTATPQAVASPTPSPSKS